MGEITAISWCDHTFNPWIGCTKVSPACDGCYAEAMMDKRYGRVQWGAPGKGNGTRARTSAGNWRQPIRWNKKAEAEGTRPFVFCSSLADVFDNQVPAEWRRDLFALINATPNLIWLLLTKRPQNIVRLWAETFADESGPPVALTSDFWPRNAAIGTTVEDQTRADLNIPHLLEAKKALNPAFAFLSCEPLLGPIDIKRWAPTGRPARRAGSGEPFIAPHYFMTRCEYCGWFGSSEFCGLVHYDDDADVSCPSCKEIFSCDEVGSGIDWVITGGETDQGGHQARPTHPNWFRSLRDQCAAAGVAFHHKQNGEWIGVPDLKRLPGGVGPGFGAYDHCPFDMDADAVRVGKNRSGRLLDGIEHNARPAITRAADKITVVI